MTRLKALVCPPKAEGHEVKSENADAAPVEAADDSQDEGDLVDNHGMNFLLKLRYRP